MASSTSPSEWHIDYSNDINDRSIGSRDSPLPMLSSPPKLDIKQGGMYLGQVVQVVLPRTEAGLGCSIIGGVDTIQGGLFFNFIAPTVKVDIRVGDRILTVNGEVMLNKKHSDGIRMLRDGGERIRLTLLRFDDVQMAEPSADTKLRFYIDRVGKVMTISPRSKGASLGVKLVGGSDTKFGGTFVSEVRNRTVLPLEVGDRVLMVDNFNLMTATEDDVAEVSSKITPNMVFWVLRLSGQHRQLAFENLPPPASAEAMKAVSVIKKK